MVFPSEIRGQCNRRQPAKGIKPKMSGHKLRGVNWQQALKHKGTKQTGVKQDLGVLLFLTLYCKHNGMPHIKKFFFTSISYSCPLIKPTF
jgi:hypothetical protein